jgi:hypothetical protein
MPKVITFVTEKQGYYDLFIDSCCRYSIEPVILGWNEKWVGYGKKLIAIRNYIKNLPAKEIVIIVDAFDVIFLCGLDEIEYKFNKTSYSFLCGALNLGKLAGKVYNYEFNKTGVMPPATPYNYSFLNSGTWISSASYAQYLIDELIEKYQMTELSMDQQLLTALYVQNLYNVNIDWSCEIFHNVIFKDIVTRKADLKDLKFYDNRALNTASGTKPCIIHAPGNTDMKELALKLGYESNILNSERDAYNFTKKSLFHIGQIIIPQSSKKRETKSSTRKRDK